MKQTVLTWDNVQGLCLDIARQLQQSQWMPDYIVGITRGGAVPAVLLSQYLGVRCEMLKVSLRDGNESESNLWMAEDAFGYNDGEHDPLVCKKLLLVDDINDTGATFNWIKQDWRSGCRPNDPAWDQIWGNNVKIATLVNNFASTIDVDYSSLQINKLDDPQWIIFPWEDWWKATK